MRASVDTVRTAPASHPHVCAPTAEEGVPASSISPAHPHFPPRLGEGTREELSWDPLEKMG